jgi:two-component system, NarL family, sensor histidine kinase UhpB
MSTHEAALGGARWRRARPSPIRMLQALWYRGSIRAQLLAVFIVIDVVAALVAGGVTIVDARGQTRVEVAASMRLAELLVGEAVGLMQQEVPAEQFLADLPPRLRLVRHVRLEVKDAAGNPLAVGPPADRSDARRDQDRAPAPNWFAALIAPPIESQDVPVAVNGQRIGTIAIIGEPSDEIAEVWDNTVALGGVALAVNVAVIGILYVLFGRVLDPLTGLAGGLSDLGQRHYEVRLPRPQARELAGIAERFNALAAALETTRAENLRLSQRLITAQDDERRRTALELHDEVGPCLFGLKANATSIEKAAAALSDAAAGPVRERAHEMLAIIEHVQAINRSLLNRLRPMALGHVPLRDILAELVSDRARQHPEIAFTFAADGIERGYDDSIDLTIYRCIQESLTNAIRHARARHIDVAVGEAGAVLILTVRDDGRGIAPGAAPGFGMSGMQERVQGLGGDYAVESAPGRGTCVHIAIPVRAGGAPARLGDAT